ncbi:MAG: NUDIX domain-containing protein [Candidatus Limnocylindria bacterium]|jgi:ADP-ribose pyrophosphatase YjhB (NUDIX family)
MRRSRRLRWTDAPRLLIGGAVQFAGLFGGRYRRTEGAHVLVIDEAGRILVVRTTYLGPGWMLPGGRIERGETPHDGAARETREETGLTVTVERLVLVDARRGRDVSFVFRGRLVGGDLEPQFGEIAEVAWVDREEIARTSRPLHELLELIEAAGDGVAYFGL